MAITVVFLSQTGIFLSNSAPYSLLYMETSS